MDRGQNNNNNAAANPLSVSGAFNTDTSHGRGTSSLDRGGESGANGGDALGSTTPQSVAVGGGVAAASEAAARGRDGRRKDTVGQDAAADEEDEEGETEEERRTTSSSLPLCYDRSELFTLGSRPGMECMPLRSPPGPYHYHVTSDQTKSLQELQNEVGALLEFRDLVIETFPDLKHKMASMSASNTITGIPTSSMASRRDWEPGIRVRRKLTQKEHAVDIQSSSSLIRSRSNSHSGKKEPKSGEGNGSVVQDSGFSTETSSSKETHSASSTSGGAISSTTTIHHIVPPTSSSSANPIIHPSGHHVGSITGSTNTTTTSTTTSGPHRMPNDGEDELWNLLDVIHRKSMRLRDEVDHLQTRHHQDSTPSSSAITQPMAAAFQEHRDRLSRDDVQILRKERDRLLEKLFQMEGDALSDRIRASQLQDSVETLQAVKQDLEAQLKSALTQKMELNSRILDMHHSDPSLAKHRTLRTSAATAPDLSDLMMAKRPHLDPSEMFASAHQTGTTSVHSTSSVIAGQAKQHQLTDGSTLGRLDGVVSSPNRSTRVRVTDSKKIAAILLETNIVELQRHLLTITVQNQVLTQRLEQATKSKIFLNKKLVKAKEDIDDLRFQLEEKSIDLEGTRAQLRVIETKSLNSSTSIAKSDQHLQPHHHHHHHHRRTSSPEQFSAASAAAIALMTASASQVSTPSMKAMTPLAMDELNHHHNSSSTESAQDQTELDSHHLHLQHRAETPRKRPSKIPLPGSKGYLAPKPPTGRSPTTPSPSGHGQRTSPSGPASNRSLSKSTGSLIGASSTTGSARSAAGPNSVSRREHPSSLNRPESAQSLRKDSSLSSSRSSSIPVATTSPTSTKQSPTARHNNSPLPKPKRDTLTSRVRQMDSLTRVQTSPPYGGHSPLVAGSPLTTSTTSPIYTAKGGLKKDTLISSSFSQGQTRDRKATAVSVRRVSSASVGRGGGIDVGSPGATPGSGVSANESDNGKEMKCFNRRQTPDRPISPRPIAPRVLIREYLARNSAPPAIFKPSFQAFSPPPALELAYKHPRLLFDHTEDQLEALGYADTLTRSSINSSKVHSFVERNRELTVQYVDDNSIELLDARLETTTTTSVSQKTASEKRSAFTSIETTTTKSSSSDSQPNIQSPTTCKLVGKVKPNLIKTWEQLNASQTYRVNRVDHHSSAVGDPARHPSQQQHKSDDFYDSIDDDQFVSELNRIPSMCDDDYEEMMNDDEREQIGNGVEESYAGQNGRSEVMAQFESLDKRKMCWSTDSEQMLN